LLTILKYPLTPMGVLAHCLPTIEKEPGEREIKEKSGNYILPAHA
jgi:hypothetical protein